MSVVSFDVSSEPATYSAFVVNGVALNPDDPIITYRLLTSGSRRQYWLGGGGATPVFIPQADYAASPGLAMTRGRLSPDGTKIAYAYLSGSGATGEIRVGSVSAGGSATTVATGAAAGKAIGDPFWHPDGTKLVYVRESSAIFSGSNGYAEIRQVNADGTGDTLLYSRTSPASTCLPYFNLDSGARYNLDGTLIAWFDDGQTVTSGSTVRGIWVMNADGTGASRRVASGGAAGSVSGLIGWSRTATDTFALLDFDTSSVRRLAKATTAGTVTTLSSSNLLSPSFDYVWYHDDSALSVANYIYSTEPKGDVAKIAVPGGTVTNLSPEERTIMLSGGAPYGPVVFGRRIYWYNGSTTRIESVVDDGTGFRVDHDLAAAGLTFETFIL